MEYHIEIGTWVNGAPTIIRTIQHDGDLESGIACLRDIGHSWQYDINHVGYLKDEEGKTYATLNIYKYTYGVKRAEGGGRMSVYVDNFRASVRMGDNGTWKMSHMIADTRSELDEMAEKIDLEQRWKQKVGEQKEHFDVTESYRKRAISAGAISVSIKDLVKRLIDRDLKYYLEH